MPPLRRSLLLQARALCDEQPPAAGPGDPRPPARPARSWLTVAASPTRGRAGHGCQRSAQARSLRRILQVTSQLTTEQLFVDSLETQGTRIAGSRIGLAPRPSSSHSRLAPRPEAGGGIVASRASRSRPAPRQGDSRGTQPWRFLCARCGRIGGLPIRPWRIPAMAIRHRIAIAAMAYCR